ncbi:MAG TPA: DUF222 domain-containing protein [Mycobacteriales bacterium]
MTTATVDPPHVAPIVSAGMTALARALRQVAVEDVASVDDVTLGERLGELRRIAGALDGEFARTLAVFDARAAGRADGAASTQAWLRWRTRLHPREAHQRVAVARALGDLPATAGALADGTVSHGHAAVIASTAADVGPEHARVAEPILLEAARTMDPGSLRRLATRIRYAADADGVLGDAEKVFARRRLHLSSTFGGMVVLDGLFDPESGATLMAALTAMSAPRRVDDPRSAAQAKADALVELARRALDRGELPEQSGERPHLVVTVDLTSLRGNAGAPPAELDWTGPIPAETARRIACDAGVSRVLMAGKGQVLDVGRTTRIVPAAVRKALAVRDGGCRFPGCFRPPPFTDAHHIVSWLHGGATALDNLILLCRFHHRWVHERRWHIRLDRDGGAEIRPP